MTEIYPSSDKLSARAKILAGSRGAKAKYQWDDLAIGQSFFINKGEGTIKLPSLQAMAYKRGKAKGKKFIVIEHPEGYEVGRVEPISKKGEVKKVEVKSVQSSATGEPINHWALPTAEEIAARQKKA